MDKAAIRAKAEKVWGVGVYHRLPPPVHKIEAALTQVDKEGYERGWDDGKEAAANFVVNLEPWEESTVGSEGAVPGDCEMMG